MYFVYIIFSYCSCPFTTDIMQQRRMSGRIIFTFPTTPFKNTCSKGKTLFPKQTTEEKIRNPRKKP